MMANNFLPLLLFSAFSLSSGFIATNLQHQNLRFFRSLPSDANVVKSENKLICYASRMPVFDADDEEQLRKIMAGEFWEDDMPDFSDNLPTREKVRAKVVTSAAPPVTNVASNSVSEKRVTAPNANWRTATDAERAQTKANPLLIPKPAPLIKKKKPVPAPSSDYLDFSDLDYDDFESAMRLVMLSYHKVCTKTKAII